MYPTNTLFWEKNVKSTKLITDAFANVGIFFSKYEIKNRLRRINFKKIRSKSNLKNKHKKVLCGLLGGSVD